MGRASKNKSKNIVEAGEDPGGEGHNITGKFSKDRLKKIVKRIESVSSERDGLNEDIKHLYKEAKDSGLSREAIRKVISDRKKDKDSVVEFEETVRLYKESLGDFSSTPLGKSMKDEEEE